jgi:hypothetical protein
MVNDQRITPTNMKILSAFTRLIQIVLGCTIQWLAQEYSAVVLEPVINLLHHFTPFALRIIETT